MNPLIRRPCVIGASLDLRSVALSVAVRARKLHISSALYLNRFLFDTSELDPDDNFSSCEIESSVSWWKRSVTLPKDDYRTVHAAKILNLRNGDTIRAGIVGGDNEDCHGLVTDLAEIEWLPEGKIKKSEPTKNGEPPGSLRIALRSLSAPKRHDDGASVTPPVSLILALPRPLQLGRILPMVAQMGVDELVLTSAAKVPKDYFGSHLFRKPNELRAHLIEGLCLAGDVRIPRVTVVRRLKMFLEDEIDRMFPRDKVARVIAHPQRAGDNVAPLRMRDIQFPFSVEENPPRIVLAVGPEGGWAEDYELEMFRDCGFQQITLGTRVLRSDVAVVSLLSLAHDICSAKTST